MKEIIKNHCFIIIAAILIIIAFAVFVFPLVFSQELDFVSRPLVITSGVCQIILVSGILALCFLIAYQCFTIDSSIRKEVALDNELKNRLKVQELLMKDAASRREQENIRNIVSDFFRLAEVAKDKLQKTESIVGGEKQD